MPSLDMTPALVSCTNCRHQFPETALFCPNCGTAKVRDQAGDALLGKVLGERFLVQERIGHGASGTIYRAEHVTLRRKVAVKVLHHELSRDDLAVERFRREATSVGEIDNEHIVENHDFGRTPDGRLYLAMELLDGETLDVVIARERQLSVERATDVLIQAGEALMEAHAIGYVHRDLRPRNLFLTARRGKANFVKLLDFGLAKLVETDSQAASTSLGMTFGDPRYMSPEQARGDRIDRRADIYQLGCVAYEMLTGAPPFVGSRVFDVLSKHVSEAPVPLPTKRPGVPLWLESSVARMLAKQPDDRFATTSRMVEALRRGLETGEVMEVEVARRRETIPPPSVSRVMQKMGLSAPIDAEPPVPVPVPVPPPPRVPTPRVVPAPVAVPAPVVTKETSMGRHVAPVITSSTAATAPAPAINGRETTMGRHTAPPQIDDDVTPAVASPPYVPGSPYAPPPRNAMAQAPTVDVPAVPQLPSVIVPSAPVIQVPPAAAAPAAYDVRATSVERPFVPAPPVLPAPSPAEESGRRRRPSTGGHGPSTSSSHRRGRPSSQNGRGSGGQRRLDDGDDGHRLNESAAGLSGAWFADGERLEDDGPELAESQVRKLDRARRFRDAAASTGTLHYEDDGHAARRKRKLIILGGGLIGVVLVITAVALAMRGSDEGDKPAVTPPPPEPPMAMVTADAAPPAPVMTIDAPPVAPPPTPAVKPSGHGGSSGSVPAVTRDVGGSSSGDPLSGRKPGGGGSSGGTSGGNAGGTSGGSSGGTSGGNAGGTSGGNAGGTSGGNSGTNDPSGSGPVDPYGGGTPDDGGTVDPYGGGGGSSGGGTPDDGGTVDPYGGGGSSGGGTSDNGTTGGGGGGNAGVAAELAKKGSASLRAGDAPAAASSFKRALEIDPKNVESIAGLGEVALQQGLYKEALVQLKKAAKLAPKSARIHTLLGEAYLNSNNSSLAAQSFKKALQIDPDSSRARNGFNEASARIPPATDD